MWLWPLSGSACVRFVDLGAVSGQLDPHYVVSQRLTIRLGSSGECYLRVCASAVDNPSAFHVPAVVCAWLLLGGA